MLVAVMELSRVSANVNSSSLGDAKRLVDQSGNAVDTSTLANFLRSAHDTHGSGLVLVGHHYLPEEYEWTASEYDSTADAELYNCTMDLGKSPMDSQPHNRSNYLHVLHDILASSVHKHTALCYITPNDDSTTTTEAPGMQNANDDSQQPSSTTIIDILDDKSQSEHRGRNEWTRQPWNDTSKPHIICLNLQKM